MDDKFTIEVASDDYDRKKVFKLTVTMSTEQFINLCEDINEFTGVNEIKEIIKEDKN